MDGFTHLHKPNMDKSTFLKDRKILTLNQLCLVIPERRCPSFSVVDEELRFLFLEAQDGPFVANESGVLASCGLQIHKMKNKHLNRNFSFHFRVNQVSDWCLFRLQLLTHTAHTSQPTQNLHKSEACQQRH